MKDFAGNTAGNLSATFTGIAESAPYLDYSMPYDLPIGKNDINVDIYGKNGIFSGAVTNVSFGSGVSTVAGSFVKIDNDHISMRVNITSSATYGPRIVSVTANGKTYQLYGGAFVKKETSTAAISGFQAKANPDSYMVGRQTPYFFEVPVMKQLSPGDSIEFQFPIGYDIS